MHVTPSFTRFLQTHTARLGLAGMVLAIGPILVDGVTAPTTGPSTANATTPDPDSIPFIKLRSEVWEIVIRRAGPGRAEVERVWAKCDGEWVNACYPDLDAASRQRALTSTFRESVQLQGDFTYCSRVAIDLPHDMARQLVRPSTGDLCLALKGPGQATIYKPGDPGTVATTQARRGSQALPASRGTRVYKGGEMPAPVPAPQPLALDDGLEGVYTPPAPAPTAPAPDPELDALLGDVPQYESTGARIQPASTGSSAARPPQNPTGTPPPQPIALDDGLEGVYTPPAPAPTAPAPDPELDALLGDVPQYESTGARIQPASTGSSAARPPQNPTGTPPPQPIALDDGLEGVYTPPAPEPTAPAPDPELDALLGDVPQFESTGAVRRPPAPAPTPSAARPPAKPAPSPRSSVPAPVPPGTRPSASSPVAAPEPVPAPAPETGRRGRKNRKNQGPTELELEEQELQNLAPIRRRDADEDEEPVGVVGPRGRYLIIDIEALPEDDLVPEREETDWGFDPDAEPVDPSLVEDTPR